MHMMFLRNSNNVNIHLITLHHDFLYFFIVFLLLLLQAACDLSLGVHGYNINGNYQEYSLFLKEDHHGRIMNVSAMFVFGDSLVDSGTNKYVNGSVAYVDFWPYGMDFQQLGQFSGRFTNNRTVADIIGEHLGFPLLPVFTNPNTTGEAILNGVNFASAGSGLLNFTFSDEIVIPMNGQIDNFETITLPQLKSLLNESEEYLSSYLSNSIFLFNTAGDDIGWSCFPIGYTTIQCEIPEFLKYLKSVYKEKLKRVYSLGARKFVLMAVQVLGCTPLARLKNDGNCIEIFNEAATMFNEHMKAIVDELNTELPEGSFMFLNSYDIVLKIIDDPSSYGFKNVTKSCCECTESSGGALCEEGGYTCSNRSNYVYFDGGHPSDSLNVVLAAKAFYSTNQTETYPYNIRSLAAGSYISKKNINSEESLGLNIHDQLVNVQ